jgi:hypothetical protein
MLWLSMAGVAGASARIGVSGVFDFHETAPDVVHSLLVAPTLRHFVAFRDRPAISDDYLKYSLVFWKPDGGGHTPTIPTEPRFEDQYSRDWLPKSEPEAEGDRQ